EILIHVGWIPRVTADRLLHPAAESHDVISEVNGRIHPEIKCRVGGIAADHVTEGRHGNLATCISNLEESAWCGKLAHVQVEGICPLGLNGRAWQRQKLSIVTRYRKGSVYLRIQDVNRRILKYRRHVKVG